MGLDAIRNMMGGFIAMVDCLERFGDCGDE